MLQKVSFDTYVTPKTKKQEIRITFDDYFKYISREFDTKEDILENIEIMSTKCYLCHRNIRRKVKWFTPNSKHYYSVAYCELHGFMKSKVRIKKAEDDKYNEVIRLISARLANNFERGLYYGQYI